MSGGSRGIIVTVHVGAVKIYVAAEEALRRKELPTAATPKESNILSVEAHLSSS
jgi:hypothetical protein